MGGSIFGCIGTGVAASVFGEYMAAAAVCFGVVAHDG